MAVWYVQYCCEYIRELHQVEIPCVSDVFWAQSVSYMCVLQTVQEVNHKSAALQVSLGGNMARTGCCHVAALWTRVKVSGGNDQS